MERESVRTLYPSSDLGLPSHGSDGGPDTSYRAGPSLLNHLTRQSTFERRFRPLETNFSESKPILGLTPRRGVVVLALALQWTSGQTTFEYFSPWFCFKFRFCTSSRAWPIGVIGVSRQALAGSLRGYGLPDMQYHHAVAISHVASSRGMVHLCAASASSVRMRQPLLVVHF